MDRPIVQISEGSLRGQKKTDSNGREYCSFEGIPYGEPPIGKLRFKAPVPVKPWKGVKDALQRGNGNLCKRVSFSPLLRKPDSYILEGSEDCLNLNVYTPQLPDSKICHLKPVMFYIHGGGFTLGNTADYGVGRIVAEDVVVVTIHYRLGALGFLVLEDPKLGVTGNTGLKDQVLALKWVQRNISSFNGDPKNVTIFGQSAGSCAVSLLVMSPTASDLFHKAILQSGCFLNTWGWGNTQNAKSLAEVLGCPKTDEADLLQFLQDLPAEKLYDAQLKLGDNVEPATLRYFAPVIEHKNSGDDAILTEDPMEILKSGKFNKVPMMIGYTDMECIVVVIRNDDCPFNIECFDEMAQVPFWLGLKKGSEEFVKVAEKIRKFYYGDSQPEPISVPTIEMSSDNAVIRGTIKFTQHVVKSSEQEVYLYKISTPLNHPEPFLSKKISGAPHGIELPLLFEMHSDSEFKSADEKVLRSQLLKMWSNFARCGNPTPTVDDLIPVTWEPVGKHMNYLEIDDTLKMGVNPEKERMEFWDELFNSFPQAKDY